MRGYRRENLMSKRAANGFALAAILLLALPAEERSGR
jgi:hypothetical protein